MSLSKYSMGRKIVKRLLVVVCICILILWVGYFLYEKMFWLNSTEYYRLEVLKAKYRRREDVSFHAYNTPTTSMPPSSENSYKKLDVEVESRVCDVNWQDSRGRLGGAGGAGGADGAAAVGELPVIYFVTPTYPRAEQVPELTRLSHTLMHVPALHWIVADDTPRCDHVVQDILRRSGLPYTHIAAPKPAYGALRPPPRGVAGRLAALAWLRALRVARGVLYFGDDDNTLDLRAFDEMRYTDTVSVFPVGLVGAFGVSAPLVVRGKVVGFFDGWVGGRRFPVDMAGFAVNLRVVGAAAGMPHAAGRQEDAFLRSVGARLSALQPRAAACSRVLVWHTRAAPSPPRVLRVDRARLQAVARAHPAAAAFLRLLADVEAQHLAELNATHGTTPYFSRYGKIFDAFDLDRDLDPAPDPATDPAPRPAPGEHV